MKIRRGDKGKLPYLGRITVEQYFPSMHLRVCRSSLKLLIAEESSSFLLY